MLAHIGCSNSSGGSGPTVNYTVTFDANGGTITTTTQTVPANTATALKTAAALGLSREGYTFGGWAKASSATTADYADGASVTLSANLKLYALWTAAPTPGTTLDLSTVTADTVIANNTTVTGTLGANVKISIADGATVTLKDVTINGTDNDSYKWAGLTCAGGATITLEGTNTVKGFWKYYPGLFVPKGKTLTIKGSGSLNASSNERGAGIGGCYKVGGISIEDGSCGTIVIEGGTITATGGYAAGIGCGYYSDCDGVTIKGGTVTATSGVCAAGIGSCQGGSCGPISITGGTVTARSVQGAAGVGTGQGDGSKCGAITVATTVTKFKAIKADGAIDSVGRGKNGGACGAVTICGTVYWDGSQYQNGGDTILTQGTYTYDPKLPTGGIDGLFSVSATKKVYFSKGNLRATYDGSWTWSFADHQYDAVGNAAANTSINGNGTVEANGSVDLFGWVGDSSGFTGEAAFGISNSTTVSDYGTGDGEALKSDWGTNAISNGGNVANYGWRTLTKDEWNYVVSARADADSKKGAATVSGVKGWILLPDAWTLPAGASFTARCANGYTTNTYTAEQWAVMESAGAVFLPVTGLRNVSSMIYPDEGRYWSATVCSNHAAYDAKLTDSSFVGNANETRYRAAAVRLAKDSD
jgi:uncharacterized repeat protein (TIGR02543 family)